MFYNQDWQRTFQRWYPGVTLEPQIQVLTDEQLRGKTEEFRKRVAGGEALNDLLDGTKHVLDP